MVNNTSKTELRALVREVVMEVLKEQGVVGRQSEIAISGKPTEELTSKQSQVLQLLNNGRSISSIAREIGVSETRVRAIMGALVRKGHKIAVKHSVPDLMNKLEEEYKDWPNAKKALDEMKDYIKERGLSGADGVLRREAPEIWDDLYKER